MKRAACVAAALLLAACQHKPPERVIITTDTLRTDTEPLPSEDTAPPSELETNEQPLAEAPPCLPVEVNPPVTPKPRRPVVRTPPPAPEPAPPPVQTAREPSVKPVENLSMSILGKKVHGAQGEDFGRVVDVIADLSGRVKVAIVEFGGFLGVGLKRVAVDWSLLKFQPGSADSPWLLDVPAQKLQTAPEYKDGHPYALMAPPAAASAAPQGDAPNTTATDVKK